MEQVKNKYGLKVITPEGLLLKEMTLSNIPLKNVYPEQDMIAVDWLKYDAKGNIIRPTTEQIQTPIMFEGEEWYGDAYWGSFVKKGFTYAVKNRWLDGRLVPYAEKGVYVGRYLMNQGHWGGLIGDLNIRMSPRGTKTPFGLIEDGAGFVSRRLVDQADNGQNPIYLGRARESYTFWQRINLEDEELLTELMPRVQNQIIAASDLGKLLLEYSPASFEEKKQLFKAEPRMEYHPFIVNAIARSSSEFLTRACTAIDVGTHNGVVVPTEAKCVIPGHVGKAIIYRYPIDNWDSIQAVKSSKREQEQVKNWEVIQYTLSSYSKMIKGCVRIEDDLDVDLWVCDEDIKLGEGSEEFREKMQFNMDQRYGKGCAIGINLEWAKEKQGCDGDGDLENWVDGEKYPALHRVVKAQPEGKTPKLDKTQSPLHMRGDQIRKSMMNDVGMATSISSNTFMVKDRDILAKQIGFKSEAELDADNNLDIKIGTDGYKTNVDQDERRVHMAVKQSNIQNLLGAPAPYTNWPNKGAFRRFVPEIWHPDMTKIEEAESIRGFMDGSVPQICRWTLPSIKVVFGEPFKAEPLITFKPWALPPSEKYEDTAKVMQSWYNKNQPEANWQDPDDVQRFKTLWHEYCQPFSFEFGRINIANALWWVAHSSRSKESGAGSVFIEYFQEVLDIVKKKPGAKRKLNYDTILVGLRYQVPNLDEFDLLVEIKNVVLKQKGKNVIRKVLTGKVAGQIRSKDQRLPEDAIALVAENEFQPDIGVYWAKIRRHTQNSHAVTLQGEND